MVTQQDSYSNGKDVKFDKYCEKDSCRFNFTVDTTSQKDNTADAALHNQKRDSGFALEVHQQKCEQIDIAASSWNTCKNAKADDAKTDDDLHGGEWTNEPSKQASDSVLGHKGCSAKADEQKSVGSLLSVNKAGADRVLPPPPPFQKGCGRSIIDRVRAASIAVKRNVDLLVRGKKNIAFHKDEHSFDEEHKTGEGYQTGRHPLPGLKSNWESIDTKTDKKHSDDKHIDFEETKDFPGAWTPRGSKPNQSSKSIFDESHNSEEHITKEKDHDKATDAQDIKVDGAKDEWGDRNRYLEIESS